MKIYPIKNTSMNSMTYILYKEDASKCILIDCGEYETLEPILGKLNITVEVVLLTHGHSDHIHGLRKLLQVYPEVVVGTLMCGHEEIQDSRKNLSYYHGMPFTISGYREKVLNDGDVVKFNGLAEIEVISTPGHDKSCLSYRIGDALFTGDAYIPGIKVFSKFPGGNKKQAIESRMRLEAMEKEGFIIYCGHHDYEYFIK